jgi:hypothetical protein
VDAHRVDVLDRADDHDVVGVVAHDLELELAPAEHGLVEEHLPDRRRGEPARDHPLELRVVARDPSSAPAEREGRAHDARQADLAQARERLAHRRGDRAARHLQPGLVHRLAEAVAVLGAPDRLDVGADELDPEARERAVLVQGHREVQRGLAAERGQERVGTLALDDLRHGPGQQRLDVGRVGELRVGHDRRGVGVDEDDLVALLAQDLARLHAGVVELRGLADDDRPRAEDEDPLQVVAPGHQLDRTASRKRSNW